MLDGNVAPSENTSAKSRSSANLQSLGLVLLSVALGAVGQLTLKAAMNNLGGLNLSLDALLRMATSPLLIFGFVIYAASTALWLLALTKADLSFAYPFLSLTYIAVLVGGVLLFNEPLKIQRVISVIAIVIGVLIIARSEKRA
jgi:multidrug transporter EmrE-like cation transporter